MSERGAAPADDPRCPWCLGDALYERYHDEEWGVPVREDDKLFETLCMEAQQSGLSWITVLRKREGYRDHFKGFVIERVAEMTQECIERALLDPAVIRHRGKLEAIRTNARAALRLREETGRGFGEHLWSFVGHKTIVNRLERMEEAVAKSPESIAMSKDLKRRGFAFVGPTTCYAFMQACGMVNDHLVSCPRWAELQHGA